MEQPLSKSKMNTTKFQSLSLVDKQGRRNWPVTFVDVLVIHTYIYTVCNPCDLPNSACGEHLNIILSFSWSEFVELTPCIYMINMYTIKMFPVHCQKFRRKLFYFTFSWHLKHRLLSDINRESETCAVMMKVKIHRLATQSRGGLCVI